MSTPIVVDIPRARHALMQIPAAAELHRRAMAQREPVRAWAQVDGGISEDDIIRFRFYAYARSSVLQEYEKLCSNLGIMGKYDQEAISEIFFGHITNVTLATRGYLRQTCTGWMVPRSVLTARLVSKICGGLGIRFPDFPNLTHALAARACRNVFKNAVWGSKEVMEFDPANGFFQGYRHILRDPVFTEPGFDNVLVEILSPLYGIEITFQS